MLSVSNLLCDLRTGNEALRYGHRSIENRRQMDTVPRPVVVWAVTKACNLRCVHCYASADARPASGELNFDEAIELLNDLRQFDVPGVLFSGGEPLSRPDVLELIAHAQHIGLNCTLSTNGLLITETIADQLAASKLKYVGISLDGTQARHDKLRGMTGAFEQSLAAIERCRRRGISVGVRFTVHSLNVVDLDSIFDICIERGVQRLCIYHLAYAGRGGKMQKADLSALQTRAVMDRIFTRARATHSDGHHMEILTVANHADAAYLLLQLHQTDPARYAAVRALLEGSGGNRSGCNVASIDPIGNAHYDQFSWHYSCGNIRQQPFSQIWREATDPRLATLRHRTDSLPPRCQQCRFLSVCNGNLRTRAEFATQNWLGDDPGCYLTDSEITASDGVA